MKRAVLVLFAVAVIGCDGGAMPVGPDASTSRLDFGERCTDSSECGSGVCVGIADGLGVCSRSCDSDADCPDADNWACVMPSERPELAVCGCRPDADEERCADGRDNDCDGRTDDCLVCAGRVIAGDDDEHCGMCFESCEAEEECRGGECRCRDRAGVFCDGRCVGLSEDIRHCGACDNACRTGDVCVDGECVCPPGRSGRCPDGCFDLQTDPSQCGSCGNVCAAGLECIDGTCGCPADRSHRCGDACVDTSMDARNCGGCGNVCAAGTVCRGGACECDSSTDSDWCDGLGCVDFVSDPANCGGCGNACGASLTCRDGACACSTSSAPDFCSASGCTSLAHDASNCGSCGNVCPAGLACLGGVCQCPDGRDTLCDGECVNTSYDAQNCGGCGRACLPGEFCYSGSSSCSCPSRLICDGVCVPADAANCGGCGITCGPDQVCSAGACVCPSGLETFCGDGCHALGSDVANCGACGNACGVGQSCSGGRCVCPSGQTWCSSLGACVNLSTDPASCGACGNACRATEVCSSGTCACPSYVQRYCDSVGACVDTRSDPSHCGACDNACPGGTSCSYSTCRCPVSGELYCASTGTCVDVRADDAHCGACDNSCPAGSSCSASACVCATAGETACASGCTDVDADDSNCGACGNVCSATQQCRSGACSCLAPTLGAERRFTTSTGQSSGTQIARNPTAMAMVYSDQADSSSAVNVFFQPLGLDGAPSGPRQQVTPWTVRTADAARDPDIVWTGTDWGLVWYEYHSSSSAGGRRDLLVLERLAPDGTVTTPRQEIVLDSSSGYSYTAIRLAYTPMLGFVIGARYGSSPIFQVLGDGSAPGGVFRLGSGSWGTDCDIAVGTSGEIGAVYADGGDIGFQRFEPDGSRIRLPVLLHENVYPFQSRGSAPALAHDGTRFVAAFARQDIPLPHPPPDSYTMFVCYVDDCASPTAISHVEGYSSSDQVVDLRMDATADTGIVGWKWMVGTRYDIRGARVHLSPSGPPTAAEPVMQYMASPSTFRNSNWGLSLVGSSFAVLTWQDDRSGYSDIYDRTLDLGVCAP